MNEDVSTVSRVLRGKTSIVWRDLTRCLESHSEKCEMTRTALLRNARIPGELELFSFVEQALQQHGAVRKSSFRHVYSEILKKKLKMNAASKFLLWSIYRHLECLRKVSQESMGFASFASDVVVPVDSSVHPEVDEPCETCALVQQKEIVHKILAVKALISVLNRSNMHTVYAEIISLAKELSFEVQMSSLSAKTSSSKLSDYLNDLMMESLAASSLKQTLKADVESFAGAVNQRVVYDKEVEKTINSPLKRVASLIHKYKAADAELKMFLSPEAMSTRFVMSSVAETPNVSPLEPVKCVSEVSLKSLPKIGSSADVIARLRRLKSAQENPCLNVLVGRITRDGKSLVEFIKAKQLKVDEEKVRQWRRVGNNSVKLEDSLVKLSSGLSERIDGC